MTNESVMLMMRKIKFLLFGISSFVLLVLLCVCSQNNTHVKSSTITKWPENTYTSQIPKPSFGQPSSLISTSNGCGVLLDDCGEENLISYIEVLYGSGYTMLDTAESDSSKVSLLGNGSTFIQLTFSGGTLLVGIYNTMPAKFSSIS